MATSLEIFHRYRQAHPPAEGFSLRDLQEIVSFVLGMSSEDLFLNHKVEFSFEKKKILEALLERKSQGEPLAYILGSVSFYGCKIFVDRSVLIPRMETEILLEKTLARVARQPIHCVYDLCSGSGCLGIAFKKQHPKCRVYLADISQEALSVASRNALANHVEVQFLLGDFLEAFENKPKADLLFCNPPYVAEEEWETLERSVKDFEPRLALTAEDHGLEFFKKLSCEASKYLNTGALLALEIGAMQKQAVALLFSESPWKNVVCQQDYAGLDRFIFLEKE